MIVIATVDKFHSSYALLTSEVEEEELVAEFTFFWEPVVGTSLSGRLEVLALTKNIEGLKNTAKILADSKGCFC